MLLGVIVAATAASGLYLAEQRRNRYIDIKPRPVAYTTDWLLFFSDKSKVLTIGIVSVAGVIAGSAVVALLQKSFRWEGFGGVEDTVNHLAGAALMGVGGVAALGCTIGQGLSGISTLSVGSAIALAAIVAGGFLGLRWQLWRLEKMV